MEIKTVKISELRPHPKNPRVHPDSAIEKLERSIKEFGWTNRRIYANMGKHTEKLELIDIDKLIPYANNARIHSDEQIKKLQAGIREFGFVNPVLYVDIILARWEQFTGQKAVLAE